MAKRRGGSKSRGFGNKKGGGRPFGESSSSGKGLMTKYTRASGGNRATMTFKGRPARSNGIKMMKGMSALKRGAWGN